MRTRKMPDVRSSLRLRADEAVLFLAHQFTGDICLCGRMMRKNREDSEIKFFEGGKKKPKSTGSASERTSKVSAKLYVWCC